MDLGAATGRAVRAAAPGTVSFAGPVGGRGVVSVVLEGTGAPPLRTTYEPVAPSVRKGDRLRAGDVLGTIQADVPSHCAAQCVHWGLLRADQYLDPLSLLPESLLHAGHSRLLPIFGVPRQGMAPAAAMARKRKSRGGPPGAAAALLAASALWARTRLSKGRPQAQRPPKEATG
ncbi:hypothetical protein GCM10012280_46880 [Wenjunlia tyrosinilytica]|uniref:M23ase beta-sheet core domain-containing protein n=1 Tax=Wenjunlia tyrosinilytica TaxID=1544741 RepID=A0A917ZT19_9ACTN|nr:hypothetical protein GCM10012280_46880 [Wenjunlia tyrosinilytica]